MYKYFQGANLTKPGSVLPVSRRSALERMAMFGQNLYQVQSQLFGQAVASIPKWSLSPEFK
jgi:hypothetical protein